MLLRGGLNQDSSCPTLSGKLFRSAASMPAPCWLVVRAARVHLAADHHRLVLIPSHNESAKMILALCHKTCVTIPWSTCLVLALGQVATRLTRTASFVAALLFALLPIHAETVSWISGRPDLMVALFSLSSFLAYTGWRRTQRGSLYWASIGLFFFALFSKESAIPMVATLVLYDTLVARPGGSSCALWRAYLPLAVITLSYLLLRYAIFGSAIKESELTLGRLVRFGERQWTYLQMLVFGSQTAPAESRPPWDSWRWVALF
jgi:hypothetical protein